MYGGDFIVKMSLSYIMELHDFLTMDKSTDGSVLKEK